MVELLPGVAPALLHNAQLDHRKVRNESIEMLALRLQVSVYV